jgi:subtilisin-like proprotein convertase family protein
MNSKYSYSSGRRWMLALTALSLAVLAIVNFRPFHAEAATNVVFSNPAPITINTNQPVLASPYPSNVTVAGMTGNVTAVSVTLTGLTHAKTSDLDMLLVGPTGVKFKFLSDAIAYPVSSITLVMTNATGSTLPAAFPNFTGGSFRATDWNQEPDTFPAPAPAPPYSVPFQSGSATFSVFNGTDPNGVWSLYISDDAAGNGGSISGGWTLNVTTTGTANTAFPNATPINIVDNLPLTAAASPYPSTIDVTGLTGVLSKVTVTLTGLTHQLSRDVDVLLVTPNGTAIILMSDSGTADVNNATLVFDDVGAVISSTAQLVSGTYKPTNNFDTDVSAFEVFPDPAPPEPYIQSSALLSSLNGYSPNGQWKLFIVDDASLNSGTLSGGWSLDITTVPYVPPVLSCLSPVFAPADSVAVTAGGAPTGLASADFNGDGKADLVEANQSTNTIGVSLGDGAGGFGALTTYATGSNPYAVAVGQFSADTNLDIVVSNSGSNNVSLFLGDGMGGFTFSNNFLAGANPISIAVGDFNNDMKQDLAVANFGGFFAGTVSILAGTVSGFAPPVNVPVRTQPSYVVVGEFNGDTKPDLAVANFGSNNLSILLGTGSGTFTFAADVPTGSGPVALAVADFNEDTKADLAVANYNSNTVQFFTGSGTGTFAGAGQVSTGSIPISLAVADVNADGHLDLAVAYRGLSEVKVLFNNGSGVFGQGSGIGNFPVGTAPNAIITADFNNDGEPDFATANTSSDDISLLINSCAIANGNREDIDGDRRTDFTVFRPSAGTWYIKLSGTPTTLGRLLGTTGDKIVPADYSGDGLTDIGVFRPSTGTWIVPNFQTNPSYLYYIQFGVATDIPVPADFDGDGRADLAVYRPSDGVWYLRRSADNSSLAVPFGISEDKPVPADYDGDGKADIAVYRPSVGSWYILQSSDGMLRSEQFGISADRPVQADYDGDGKADLAVFRPADGAWYISQSSNSAFVAYFWGVGTDVPVPGDYDGDGKFDIAVWRPSTGYWYVLLSLSGSVQTEFWGTSGDIPGPSAYVQ